MGESFAKGTHPAKGTRESLTKGCLKSSGAVVGSPPESAVIRQREGQDWQSVSAVKQESSTLGKNE